MTKRSQARSKRSSRRPRSRRAPGAARWWLLPIGLGAAAAAGWVLLSSGPLGSRGEPAQSSEPPHADIGEASRAQLREILRDADREESAQPVGREGR